MIKIKDGLSRLFVLFFKQIKFEHLAINSVVNVTKFIDIIVFSKNPVSYDVLCAVPVIHVFEYVKFWFFHSNHLYLFIF